MKDNGNLPQNNADHDWTPLVRFLIVPTGTLQYPAIAVPIVPLSLINILSDWSSTSQSSGENCDITVVAVESC